MMTCGWFRLSKLIIPSPPFVSGFSTFHHSRKLAFFKTPPRSHWTTTTTSTTGTRRCWLAGAKKDEEKEDLRRTNQSNFPSPSSSSSSSSRNIHFSSSLFTKEDQDRIIQLQTQESNALLKEQPAQVASMPYEEYILHQQTVFDKVSDWFAQRENEVPPEYVPIYQQLAEQIIQELPLPNRYGIQEEEVEPHNNNLDRPTTTFRILDVACGTGVLWEFFFQAAETAAEAAAQADNASKDLQKPILQIVGVDLSSCMVQKGQERAEQLQQQSEFTYHPLITVIQDEICDYCSSITTMSGTTTSTNQTFASETLYHGIVVNACFGNFWNPRQVLESLSTVLEMNGTLSITHPLGAEFVQQLHDNDPTTVPHVLPATRLDWLRWTIGLPLTIRTFCRTVTIPTISQDSIAPLINATTTTTKPFYLASFRKGPAILLQEAMKFRGPVDKGYGRGGKKLGVPTANLPARFFQNALESVQTGVYFGWAVLEDNQFKVREKGEPRPGRMVPHKAVVNVGYSPTFEGQENPEKIIEAHLMLEDDSAPLSDFYGETMRLQLSGFLRPERKFPSFPQLIQQIHTDIANAKHALDAYPYAQLVQDSFIQNACHTETEISMWVGSNGGDEAGSWEFGAMIETLKEALPDE